MGPKHDQQNKYFKQKAIGPDPGPEILNQMDKVERELHLEGTVAVTDYTVAADLQDLDDKIKSMMEVSENHVGGKQRGFNRICKVCGKEGAMNLIISHIEFNHITGVSHTCNICGTVTRSRNAMAKHKQRNHTTK